MEVTLFIERRFEEEFRKCVERFESMAIVDTIEPVHTKEWIYMIVEDTNETNCFIEDLFLLGRRYEWITNLPY